MSPQSKDWMSTRKHAIYQYKIYQYKRESWYPPQSLMKCAHLCPYYAHSLFQLLLLHKKPTQNLVALKQKPFLLCSQSLWVRNSERAQRGWLVFVPWHLDLSWEDWKARRWPHRWGHSYLEVPLLRHLGPRLLWLEDQDCWPGTCMWLLHVAWAPSYHGSLGADGILTWLEVFQRAKVEAASLFMTQPQKPNSVNFLPYSGQSS